MYNIDLIFLYLVMDNNFGGRTHCDWNENIVLLSLSTLMFVFIFESVQRAKNLTDIPYQFFISTEVYAKQPSSLYISDVNILTNSFTCMTVFFLLKNSILI